MSPSEILTKLGIDPDQPVLLITANDALWMLMDAACQFCEGEIRFDEMKKEEVESLLSTYGECVVDYHPENYHQARAALLQHFDVLKKYGAKEEDYEDLDFI